MKKSTISLTVTLLLGASFALSGCGSSSSPSADTQGNSGTNATTSTNDKTPAEAVTIRTTIRQESLPMTRLKNSKEKIRILKSNSFPPTKRN